MNLGRELGEIINSQQDRILSLAHENTKLKKELWHLKSRRARNGSKIACNRWHNYTRETVKRQITPKI